MSIVVMSMGKYELLLLNILSSVSSSNTRNVWVLLEFFLPMTQNLFYF